MTTLLSSAPLRLWGKKKLIRYFAFYSLLGKIVYIIPRTVAGKRRYDGTNASPPHNYKLFVSRMLTLAL